MRTTSAATRAQCLTSNGKTLWNAISRQSYRMSPQPYKAKTFCAPTPGPTLSLTGHVVFITLFPMPYCAIHRLGSSTRHLWSTPTTSTGSFWRPAILPTPRPRTPLEIRRKERHWITSNFYNGTPSDATSVATPYPTRSFTMRSWTYSPTGRPPPPKKTPRSF